MTPMEEHHYRRGFFAGLAIGAGVTAWASWMTALAITVIAFHHG